MLAVHTAAETLAMASDDDFKPRLGRQRALGTKRVRSYLGRILAATNRARAGRSAGRSAGSFSGSRSGRGVGVGRLIASRGQGAAFGQRRVIVKARIVRLAGKGSNAAAAHLRYLERDGTTRNGARGAFYGRDGDVIDGHEFHARGNGDRHQFRFIVSPEDSAEYDDLKPLTRRLMARVEADLGTRLDWVAVDHFNTGHPHTHIVVRGRDHLDHDLIIARDYLTMGMRERAAELVDLDLGPRSAREIETSLRAEVEQERLTSIDRRLLRGLGDDRIVAARGRDAFEQTLSAGRLAKLARMELAEPIGAGRYRLASGVEDTLRAIGERGDIIRTMQREFARRGLAPSADAQVIYDPAAEGVRPLVGRVISRGLADELSDRHYLIVDATDGRAHYVATGRGDTLDALATNAIVRVEPLRASVRAIDQTVAAVAAANHGRYDVEAHLLFDPTATNAFAETHVRRLEALRRGGAGVERDAAARWTIPPDHLDRVLAYEQARLGNRPVGVTLLSAQRIEQLVNADGATWLDRELLADQPEPLRDAGFGQAARIAQQQRRQWLVGQGLAEDQDGATRFRTGLLATLQRRELLRVAGQLSDELALPFLDTPNGMRVEGIYRRPVELVSGRFALIENSREFMLVPWRPVLEPHVGKSVSGILRRDGVSWTIGRGRGGPSIS